MSIKQTMSTPIANDPNRTKAIVNEALDGEKAVPVELVLKATDDSTFDQINANNGLPVSLTGSNVKLLDVVSATGVGTLKPAVGSFKTYVFEVWGTASSFTLRIEAVGPSGTARTINKVWDELNNAFLSGSDITAAGFYSVSVPAFTNIQANVTAISGGNVNVNGGLMP